MRLSVIIVAPRADSALRDCIASLHRLAERPEIELILVANSGPPLTDELRAEFPEATALQAPPGSSLAAARAAGLARAAAPLVAFLGERYQVRERWASAILTGFDESADVLTGAVELRVGASWTGRAIYLWEYGHLLPPAPPGPLAEDAARLTPGGNACYRSGALRVQDLAGAFWELDYHAALVQRGARFRMHEVLTVDYMPPPVGWYLRERLEISRRLASSRTRTRLAAGLRAVLLPPVLLVRSFGRVVVRARTRRDWLLSLPWFLAFALAQAAGELAGFLSPSSPGQS